MGRMDRRQQRKTTMNIWSRLKKKSVVAKIFMGGAAIFLCGILVLNILIWTSDVSKLEDPAPRPTIIYDQKGAVASKIAASKIEGVSIKQIPKDVVNAVIATEDQLFFKHSGINYFGIIRALTQNALSGEIVAGGSTITQQLAKNVFLTNERTYTRKLKELILTKKIERTYSKEEIIERYLNQIYFGEGAWGIQSAAQTYFGKDVSQLTLSESAMLAGLIKAPSVLSPFKNKERSIERRDLVLSLMEKEGYISQQDVNKAIGQAVVLEGRKIDKYKGQYPYYVDHIIEEAITKYGLTENEVLSGGLHIYTELNPTIQDSVDRVYKDGAMFPASKPDQLIQSGAIFINPSTGGINALVGGRGEHTFRGFNRATQLKRQPGSTMKPLAVYTPALEQGYDVFDKLQDSPIDINGYKPMNYDRRFRGAVTMYEAVEDSLNVPPVWLLNKMGLKYGINAVERFGIPLTEQDYNPSLALGGLNEGVSPLLMAQAFSVFPNNGIMVEAHSIQKIEDADGETIAKWKNKAVQVTDQKVAQKMTFMLQGVVENGTGTRAQVEGLDVAGKTGSTQLPFAITNGTKDHWFVGYTPDIVGAVWLGYDKTDESHYLIESSGATVTRIFKEIVSGSVSELSRRKFDLSMVEKELNNRLKEEEKRKAKLKEDEEKKRGKYIDKEKYKEKDKKKEAGKGQRKKKDKDDD